MNRRAVIALAGVWFACLGATAPRVQDPIPSNGTWAVFLKPEPTGAWRVVSFNLDTFQRFETAATESWKPPICFHDYFLLVDAS